MKGWRLFLGGVLICGVCAALGAQQMPVEVVTLAAPGVATSFVLSRTGRLAGAVYGDAKLRLWSLPEARLQRTIELGERSLDVVALSPDGSLLAAGDHQGKYTVWDTATGAEQMDLKIPFYPIALAFSPDGKQLAIAPAGEPVQIFEIATRTKRAQLGHPVGGSEAVAFSRDGSLIAVADADTVVRIYDAGTGELRRRNADFLLEPLAVAFAADGKQLLTGGADKVMASLDVASGRLIRRSQRLDDPVASLDVSPDGGLVAATLMHADNMLKPGLVIVSETSSGRRLTQWLPATVAVGGGWTNDGHLLIATATENAVHVWRVH